MLLISDSYFDQVLCERRKSSVNTHVSTGRRSSLYRKEGTQEEEEDHLPDGLRKY